MAQYTLTLNSEEDYQLIKKLLKAFDGASIRPTARRPIQNASIRKSFEEVREGKVAGPFHSVDEFMADLLN